MSTKTGIYWNKASDGAYLYEEVCFESAPSPAYIQVGRGRFKIEHDFADQRPEVIIEIDAEEMDKLAIAWCKHRRLQGALGGPVGKEYGSPDCDYD